MFAVKVGVVLVEEPEGDVEVMLGSVLSFTVKFMIIFLLFEKLSVQFMLIECAAFS